MGHWDRTREAGPLTVQVEQAGDALMVRATGDLIRSTAPTFEAELRMVICGGASTVDLDLGGVGLIDSTGLQSMIRAGNHTLRRGAGSECGMRRRPSGARSSGAAASSCFRWSDSGVVLACLTRVST